MPQGRPSNAVRADSLFISNKVGLKRHLKSEFYFLESNNGQQFQILMLVMFLYFHVADMKYKKKKCAAFIN